MGDTEKQVAEIKKKIEQLDIENSFERMEAFKKILDEPTIQLILNKDEKTIEEFGVTLNNFRQQIKDAKDEKHELRKDLIDRIDRHMRDQERINYEDFDRYQRKKSFDLKMKLFGFLYAALSFIGIIYFSVSLAETNIIMAIPMFLGGSLLAGAACAIASGDSFNFRDYIHGMRMFGDNNNKRGHK